MNSNIVMGIYICVYVGVIFWLIQGLVNMETELSENLRCLFVYISKLPLIVQISSLVFSVQRRLFSVSVT